MLALESFDRDVWLAKIKCISYFYNLGQIDLDPNTKTLTLQFNSSFEGNYTVFEFKKYEEITLVIKNGDTTWFKPITTFDKIDEDKLIYSWFEEIIKSDYYKSGIEIVITDGKEKYSIIVHESEDVLFYENCNRDEKELEDDTSDFFCW